MVYEKQHPSLQGIEFDDEREIMSHIFDGYSFRKLDEDVDYLNASAPQDPYASNAMPEVSQVTRILLGHHWL